MGIKGQAHRDGGHHGYPVYVRRPYQARKMCRYRYQNGSPKRKRWEGWQYKAGQVGRPKRIKRLPAYEYSTIGTWPSETSGYIHQAKGFAHVFVGTDAGKAQVSWWKQHCLAGKEIGKDNGYIYWRSKRSKPKWYRELQKERKAFREAVSGKTAKKHTAQASGVLSKVPTTRAKRLATA